MFWSLVASSRPSEDALKQSAYDMFIEFVYTWEDNFNNCVFSFADCEEVLEDHISQPRLLRFVTGNSSLPPISARQLG